MEVSDNKKQFWWLPRIQDAMRDREFAAAIRWLDVVIFNPDTLAQPSLSLFEEEDRQYAMLCKARLLHSRGRMLEALAWLCLEHFLHPHNVSAVALREQLLGQLSARPAPSRPTPAAERFSLGWEGVAGMEEVKLRFERDVILPLRHPELYARYKLSPPNGVLLWGPPGCGKTFFASKLAEQLDYGFLRVQPSDTASIYVHGTVEKIADVFDRAESSAPAMIFIDELDAFAPSRTDLQHSYAEEVNELLIRLDNCSKRGVTVVGATNRPDRIDPAVKRPGRFDHLIYVPPPDMAAREQLFVIHLRGRPLDAGIQIAELAMRTGGYTCSDIKHICDEAARAAMSADASISEALLLAAIADNRPSVSSEELLEYERLREQER